MRSFWSIVILGILWLVSGLVGFVFISRTAWAKPGKDAVVLITLVGMVIFLGLVAKAFTVKRSLLVALLIALGFVAAHDLLGYLVWEGLWSKRGATWEYLLGLVLMVGLLSAAFAAVILACKGAIVLKSRENSGRHA